MQVHGSLVHWDASTRTATAEASTLGFPVGVWPDTFVVVSHKTGRKMTFAIGGYESNCARYFPLVEEPEEHMAEWMLKVFND